MIRLIAATDIALGIAGSDGIPWQGKIPTDTRYFRDQTVGGIILMGYRTYSEFDRPLHSRPNLVLCRPDTPPLRPGFIAVHDLPSVFNAHPIEVVWVIGGSAVFEESIQVADELFITQLASDFHCTKFFPEFRDDFFLAATLGNNHEGGISFEFQVWRRTRPATLP